MKMSKEHYDYLKGKVLAYILPIKSHKELIDNGNIECMDKEKRLIWDTFRACKAYTQYSCQEFDYNDSHIETAIRKILKETGVTK